MQIGHRLFLVLTCFLSAGCIAQSESSSSAEAFYLKALECGSTVPFYTGFKKLTDKKGRFTHQRITYVQNDIEKKTTIISREFRLLSNNRLFGRSVIINQSGMWFFDNSILIKASYDFILKDGFLIKRFNALDTDKSMFAFVPQRKKDDQNSIIVERRLSSEQQEELRHIILTVYRYTRWGGKIADIDNLQRVLQNMPIRALFRISTLTGILIEDSYYNAGGKLIGKLVDFDRIDVSSIIDSSVFSLPVGRSIEFPKNSDETWVHLRRL